jgi:hypothetical protein
MPAYIHMWHVVGSWIFKPFEDELRICSVGKQYVSKSKIISYGKRCNINTIDRRLYPSELPLPQVQTFLILNTYLLKIKVLEDDSLELFLFDLCPLKTDKLSSVKAEKFAHQTGHGEIESHRPA